MKLVRIEGPPLTLECQTCHATGVGGTETYKSAATGEDRTPEEWYTEHIIHDETMGVYCAECAAKLVQQDEARSLNQFFSDTAGNEILPSILPDQQ